MMMMMLMMMMMMIMMMKMMMMMASLAYGWRPPRGGTRRFRIGADVDELWQTVQLGPFSESQAQQLQAAVLHSLF